MFVATIVASDALRQGDISAARDRLAAASCEPGEVREIDPGKAADILFSALPAEGRRVLQAMEGSIDVVVQPLGAREKKLLVADMDSTMITVECIDELADYAGLKAQIAEVTERAMRGELDFAEALRSRVALLKGLEDEVIDLCRSERVQIMPGAKALVQTMAARGAKTVLVSGGFRRLASPLGMKMAFERAVPNVLTWTAARLNGPVRFRSVARLRKGEQRGSGKAH